MTIEAFLEELKYFAGQACWCQGASTKDMIRIEQDACLYVLCPITAVHYKKYGELLRTSHAFSKSICLPNENLILDDRFKIGHAADNVISAADKPMYYYHLSVPEIRRRMIDALQLSPHSPR